MNLFAVGAVVHEFLWLFHLFQEHGPAKRGNDFCFCFHAGLPEEPISFCIHSIALIMLSVWAIPLTLLFCWFEDQQYVSNLKITINLVGFGSVDGDGNTADASGQDLAGG